MAVEGRTHGPVVDNEKCSNCAICLRECPAEIIPEQRTEVDSLRGYVYSRLYEGRNEQLLRERKVSNMPPCQAACPIGQDIMGYVRLIARKRYTEALQLIRETNALPSVCGYVCHHPCEERCVRRSVDRPVRIRSLKRFVANLDDGKLNPPKVRARRDKRILIVGSGPAGLAAAYDLARNGFQVEIIEAFPQTGGMLRYAIPSFRLPRHVLDRDIRYIEEMGVRIRTGIRFGVDVSLSVIRQGGADAVIMAIGTHEILEVGIETGKHAKRYFDCLSFLSKVAANESIDLGTKTIVIGMGNAAIDSARSALRCGAREVTIVARRGPEQAAADMGEVEKALKEGIRILYWTLPVRIIKEGGEIRQVECVRTELGEPDNSGKRKPLPVAGSEFLIDAASVISAIGLRPSLSWNRERLPFDLSHQNTFTVDDNGLTNIEGIFAAGDAVNGPTTVIEAMASGMKVAKSVAFYLSREK